MADKKYGDGRRRNKKTAEDAHVKRVPSILWVFVILLLMAGSALGIAFTVGEHYYRTHFMEGTTVNGIDVSNRTAEDVKARFQNEIGDYQLVIHERTSDGGSVEEIITGGEIGLEKVFDNALREGLESQLRGNWLLERGEPHDLELGSMIQYDSAAWKMKVDQLQCFQESFIVKPVNAELSEYQSGVGYSIIPEVVGNAPNPDVIRPALDQAVLSLAEEINLEELEGAYQAPTVTADDPGLKALKENLEKYTNINITYVFGDSREVIDGDMLQKYISVDEDDNVTLDTSFVPDFVASMRKKYNTIYQTRTFMTSYGSEVVLEDGDYGWWMNYKKEEQILTEMLEKGESGERTPEYYQTAAQYGPEDYGDTYVEVNLTAQHMIFYQNGTRRLESDFVSGNASRGNDTPTGVYGITYKERNATLKGENYSSPVSFWMPFNENVGLHDATWRSEFGSDFYLSSGSHGCINLPYTVAKELYSLVSANTPVIVYRLEGTESDSVTEQGSEEFAMAATDAIDYIGEVKKTEECGKKIKRARDLYNSLSGDEKSMVTNYEDLTAAEEEFDAIGGTYPKD